MGNVFSEHIYKVECFLGNKAINKTHKNFIVYRRKKEWKR